MGLTFRKQPSGGRGEYEIVGEEAGVTAADLDEFGFELDTPFGLKQTDVILSHQGGKRRLRLTTNVPHLQRQMAALAMLPPSTRDEDSVSTALPVVIAKRYILDVDVALVNVDQAGGMVTVRPTVYQARSGRVTDPGHRESIDAAERFTRLQQVYDAVDHLPTTVAAAVVRHRELLASEQLLGKPVEDAVRNIMRAMEQEGVDDYLPGTDPLPVLAAITGLTGPIPLPLPTETPADTPEIRLRTESVYRARRVRGAGASRFRSAVQAAYDFRCAFCGLRAPTVPGRARAGVDAAHILPWGTYDLDVVPNGLMLCKQHHWAFDNHVLVLHHSSGVYELELRQDWAAQIGEDERTIEELNRVVGPVPEEWLPVPHMRPAEVFINELYAS